MTVTEPGRPLQALRRKRATAPRLSTALCRRPKDSRRDRVDADQITVELERRLDPADSRELWQRRNAATVDLRGPLPAAPTPPLRAPSTTAVAIEHSGRQRALDAVPPDETECRRPSR